MGDTEDRPTPGSPVRAVLGRYQLTVATDYGPRILDFGVEGWEGPFARLGEDVVIESPGAGTYRFVGGHRLWAAPEIPEVTYAPDDEPCLVELTSGRVRAVGTPDRAGLVKEISVSLDGAWARVEHVLTNAGSTGISVAPWAITQMGLGGTALIPFPSPSGTGPQADRALVLWPYSDLTDARLRLEKGIMLLEARPGPAWKVGVGPDPRHLGYLLAEHLFVKGFPAAAAGDYADKSAVGQVYVNEDFCELESLGPITSLQPGASVSHVEHWALFECADIESAVQLLAGIER